MTLLPETHSIVVVDDVPEIREILSFLLEESGWFRVVGHAGNGEDAITVVERERPDLVLLDIELPGMNGWEALAILRERVPASPVVVLTGSVDDIGPARMRANGLAAAVLEKGMSNRELTDRLLAVLGASRGGEPQTIDRTTLPDASGADLGDAEAWLAAVVTSSFDAVIGTKLDGAIVSWNDAAERLYGYTAEEVLGRSVELLSPKDRPDELPSLLATLARGDRIAHYETVRMRKDGSRIDVNLTISPVFALDGTIIGGAAVVRDISGRRQTEAALGRAITQLERRNRDLQRSNEELDSFAAVASHDLAQPLQVAYGFLDMLRSDYSDHLPDQGRGWLDASVSSLERMRNLVRDILRYARTGSGESRRSPVGLRDVLDDAIGALAVVIDERAARIDVDEELPIVVGDPTQLALVFQNVIANAVKFVPDTRKPLITVTAVAHAEDVVVTVTDNGIGIPPDQRGKVFEMFQRVAAGGFAGTGLGLAIVKKIVTRHGGDVAIEEGHGGVGTAIAIRLPLAGEPASNP